MFSLSSFLKIGSTFATLKLLGNFPAIKEELHTSISGFIRRLMHFFIGMSGISLIQHAKLFF